MVLNQCIRFILCQCLIEMMWTSLLVLFAVMKPLDVKCSSIWHSIWWTIIVLCRKSRIWWTQPTYGWCHPWIQMGTIAQRFVSHDFYHAHTYFLAVIGCIITSGGAAFCVLSKFGAVMCACWIYAKILFRTARYFRRLM